jgi:hypothetical protein
MSYSTFSSDNFDIIISLNNDICYVEIINQISMAKYALSIDKMILADIKVIPNLKQLYKILTTCFDEEQDEVSYEIIPSDESINFITKIDSIIEYQFTLKIPAIKSDSDVELIKLQKKIVEQDKQLKQQQLLIQSLSLNIKELNEREYCYQIPQYSWCKAILCNCNQVCSFSRSISSFVIVSSISCLYFFILFSHS